MANQTKIIDFHCHHIPARFELTAARYAPASQRARWESLARALSDEDLLLKDVRDGELDARVVSILIQLIADAEGRVPRDTVMAMNDALAGLVARHPGRIHGLASVDAYDGDSSAREAERAIGELGLRGLLLECARGDLLLDAPQARPTLEVAAKLGVPVFAHPVAPQPLTTQMAPYGLIGTLFARGAVNSAALIALVEGGVFSQLPELRVVFTAQAIGGLAMAAGLSGQSRLPSGTIEVMRKNVFIDTPSEARGPSASVPIASPARNKPRRDVGGPSPRVVQILRPWGKFPLRSGEIAGASSGHGYSVERQGRHPR